MNNFPESPLRKDVLKLDKKQRMADLEHHFTKILEILGMDLKNDSIEKTPHRMAKMYMFELFKGLDEDNFPKITVQKNSFNYDQMLIEKNIELNSVCEHHFIPILGNCHISYIPKDKVIGLSKLNRVAKYYAARPQVQERLTEQIKAKLCELLETDDVAVCIDASHLCVKMRGVEDSNSITRTTALGGAFLNNQSTRSEFFNSIGEIK